MNTRQIIEICLSVMGFLVLLSVAADLLKWAYSGTSSDRAGKTVDTIIDKVVDLPVKILGVIVKLVAKILESVLRAVVGLISPSAARTIEMGNITLD